MSDLPSFPKQGLKAAAGDAPDAHAAIDALHGELQAPAPDAGRINQHVEQLRGIPALRAELESWWLDPRVESFIAELNSAGL